MSLDATIVWEIRTTGAQTNGGGYKPGASGTDYSQQAAAQYALTTVTSGGATAIMTHASAAADMVGNTCRVVSGTNATLGWFEIISVNVGVDITVDRNWCTDAVANGVVNVGGAWAFGGTLDNAFFVDKVPGNTIWIGPGTHAGIGEPIYSATYGSAAAPIYLLGYNAARDDNPTGANRPLMQSTMPGRSFALGMYYISKHFRFTTTNTGQFSAGVFNHVYNCKFVSTGNAVAVALNLASALIFCEAISEKSYGINAGSAIIDKCYIHDSYDGVLLNNNGISITNSIIETCQTGVTSAAYGTGVIAGCTIRNCVAGIRTGSVGAAGNWIVFNNIIANCVTGVVALSNTPSHFIDYNCWSNNGTDVTNVTKGPHDVTADALLGSSIAEGTDGVTNATPGTTFTAASNPFGSVTTSDCLNIIETGTGATLGVYAISAVVDSGTLTLATSPGASKTGIDYRIVLGTDFTLQAGSPCFDAGLQLGSEVGL